MIGAPTLRGAEPQKPIRVLILSGQNNHDWHTTTPALKSLYEKSGRFVVDVSENVSALEGKDFARYDVIALNYTTYPKVKGHRWPAGTEKAFLDYIAAGHGLVLFHAASTAWNDWPEFGDLIGLTWEMGKSAHGQYHSFTVCIVDHEHPVTHGMSDFQHLPDELYHRQLLHATAHVLATAYSDKTRGGTGAQEPMVVVTELGCGRVFHVAMGHDVRPMGGAGFQTLMLRGTEWAATAKVTLPLVNCVLQDADSLLRGIAGYRFGQSRGGLAAVERLVGFASDTASKRALAAKLAAMLCGNASPDCKKFVCQQLSLIGSTTEVPVLAKLLADDDLAFSAAFALQRIPGDESLAVMRSALGSAGAKMKRQLICFLAARRDVQTVPRLAEMAVAPDRELAEAAITALGIIGGSQAAQALVAVETRVPAGLQPRLSDALLRCAQDLQATGHGNEAAALFEKLCDPRRPCPVRIAAFLGRAATLGQKGDALVLSALSGTDPVLRVAAIRALRASPRDSLLGELANRLDHLAPDIQLQAVTLLQEHGSATALAAVVRVASGKVEPVRRAAITALGSIGNASTVGVLTAVLAAGDTEDQKLVGESLKRLRGHDSDAAMIAAIPTAAPAAQCELIRALVAREAKPCVAALLAAARSSDAQVRQEASRGLGKLAGGRDGIRVVELLDQTADRSALEMALVAIYRRAGNAEPVAVALAKASGPAKASLLRVAGALGGRETLAAIRDALKTGDAEIRREAVLALSNWPDAASIDDLMAIAKTTDDATCKVLALRGVARLAPMAGKRSPEQIVELLGRATALAGRTDALKSLLSALGQVPSAAAARLAATFLDDPMLVDEASLAIVQIAENGDLPHRTEALRALKQVIATCRTPMILARAQAVPTRPNLARGATATNPDGLAADGQAGGPQAAIDGNPKTYWDEVDGEKLYQLRVEMKRPAVVATLRITGFRQHDFAPRDFDVLCDGKVVKQVKNAQYVNNALSVSLPPTQCTTVDLKITGYYGGSPAIRELEIYGPEE
jgi:type 1 glutamine amidotransferase